MISGRSEKGQIDIGKMRVGFYEFYACILSR